MALGCRFEGCGGRGGPEDSSRAGKCENICCLSQMSQFLATPLAPPETSTQSARQVCGGLSPRLQTVQFNRNFFVFLGTCQTKRVQSKRLGGSHDVQIKTRGNKPKFPNDLKKKINCSQSKGSDMPKTCLNDDYRLEKIYNS